MWQSITRDDPLRMEYIRNGLLYWKSRGRAWTVVPRIPSGSVIGWGQIPMEHIVYSHAVLRGEVEYAVCLEE